MTLDSALDASRQRLLALIRDADADTRLAEVELVLRSFDRIEDLARHARRLSPYIGSEHSRSLDVASPHPAGDARLARDREASEAIAVLRALANQTTADNRGLFPASGFTSLALGELPPATTPLLAALAVEVPRFSGLTVVPVLPVIGYSIRRPGDPEKDPGWAPTVTPSTADGPPQALVAAGVGLSDQLVDLTPYGMLLDRLLAYAVDAGCEDYIVDALTTQAPSSANLLTAIGAVRPAADVVVANPADLGPVLTSLRDRPENFGVRVLASPGQAAGTVLVLASTGVVAQVTPRQYGRTRQVSILETEAAAWRSVVAGAFLAGAVQKAAVA
jgi:hypothetical protein